MAETKSWQGYKEAFAFFSRLISYPPDKQLINEFQRLFSGSEAAENDMSAYPAYQSIAAYFEAKGDGPIDDLLQELSIDWTRLFRGVSPGYGPPPPYEGVYREADGVGVETIQAIERIYSKHGLVISDGRHDRSDYLGYELNFVEFLCEQIAKAIDTNDEEEAERYRNELDHFMADHLSTWVGDFCKQAVDQAKTPFYSAVLMMLNETISDADVAAELLSESQRG